MDPKLTEDKKPYGPFSYKQIVKECYLISKNCNTSYNDLLDITPTERKMLLQFVIDEVQRSQEAIDKINNKNKSKH